MYYLLGLHDTTSMIERLVGYVSAGCVAVGNVAASSTSPFRVVGQVVAGIHLQPEQDGRPCHAVVESTLTRRQSVMAMLKSGTQDGALTRRVYVVLGIAYHWRR